MVDDDPVISTPDGRTPSRGLLLLLRSDSTDRYAFSAVVILLGIGVAWWLSSVRMLLAIDWDNGAHLGIIDSNHAKGLGSYGYTAHLALVPLYSLGARLAYLFRGNSLDGVRLINALAIGAAVGLLAATLRAQSLGRGRTMLVCAMWLVAVDTVFLLRTVEDDCVGLAALAAVLWVMLGEATPGVRRAGFAGAVLGAGFLMNYPTIVWLPVVLVWAVVADGPSLRTRALRVVAVLGGAAVAIVAWGMWTARLSLSGWKQYWQTLTASPNGLANAPNQWDFTVYFGRYLPELLAPPPFAAMIAAHPLLLRSLLWLVVIVLVAGLLWPWRRGLARASAPGRALSLACLAVSVCSLPTVLKNDPAFYERLDHLPLLLALVVGLGMARAQTAKRRTWRWFPVCAAVAILVAQVAAIARLPQYQSQLGLFAVTRRAHPNAAAYVYAETEFNEWDYGQVVSIRFAPRVRILSPNGRARLWRFPPPGIISLGDWRRAPIRDAYLSPAALECQNSAQRLCVGDCDSTGTVKITDLILGVNIALGPQSVSACPSFDCQNNGTVPISCLIQGVNNAMSGCANAS